MDALLGKKVTDTCELWNGEEEQNGANCSATPNEQDDLLILGCQTGNIEKVKQALAAKANPSYQMALAFGKITPIFLCAQRGYKEIAELLIETKHDVIHERMGFDGTTCLHHAAANNQYEMCEMLIKAGIPVDGQDKLGRTALMDAAEIGSLQLIDLMLENNADINMEDLEQHTAISYCVAYINRTDTRFLDAALKLVNLGADPNYPGKFSKSMILHHVAAQGKMDLVKLLVEEKKAYPNPVDDKGKTPLIYAQENGHTEIVQYLKKSMEERDPQSETDQIDSCSCRCVLM